MDVALYAYILIDPGSCSATARPIRVLLVFLVRRDGIGAHHLLCCLSLFHITLLVVSDDILQMQLEYRSNPLTLVFFYAFHIMSPVSLQRGVHSVFVLTSPPFDSTLSSP